MPKNPPHTIHTNSLHDSDQIVTVRALQGLALSVGAPIGWMLIQIALGVGFREQWSNYGGVYIYMGVGSAVAFMWFGIYVGRSEQRLSQLTLMDPLTDLFNKRYFSERLRDAYTQFAREGKTLWVLLIDIDRFKQINDQYGHLVGDDVLRAVASKLVACCRAGEPVSRVGGEEFCILLSGDLNEEQAMLAGDRLRTAITNLSVEVKGVPLQLSVSVGVAASSVVDGDEWSLYNAADKALYQAKASGRNCVIVFSPSRNT